MIKEILNKSASVQLLNSTFNCFNLFLQSSSCGKIYFSHIIEELQRIFKIEYFNRMNDDLEVEMHPFHSQCWKMAKHTLIIFQNIESMFSHFSVL